MVQRSSDDNPLTWQQVALRALFTTAALGIILILAGVLPIGRDIDSGPFAIGLSLLCGSAVGAWPVWKSYRRVNRLSLHREMARTGAIQLDQTQRSAPLVTLSGTLRKCWLLGTGSIRLPSGDGSVTARDLYEGVWEALVAQDAAGVLSVYPDAIALVDNAFSVVARELTLDVNSGAILCTPLNDIFPKSRRRCWKRLSVALNQNLPAMVIPRGATYVIRFLCIAVAIGIMVVIAQHMDATDAGGAATKVPHSVGRLIGRLVLIAIAIPLIVGAMAILRPVLGRFPAHCRTVGQLVAIVASRGRASTEPVGGWSGEALWTQLRACIAESYGVAPAQVTTEFALARRLPAVPETEFVASD